MTNGEKAIDLFHGGFNCAQSVFAVFSEKYGLDREMALRVSGGMGGGFRSGEICGAASGAVLAIGLVHGQYITGDMAAKQECGKATAEFMARFRERNGCAVCRDLLGCDTSTPEGHAKAVENNLFREICDKLVAGSVELLEEMGY